MVREDPVPQFYTRNVWGEAVSPGEIVDISAGVVIGLGTGNYHQGFGSFKKYLEERVVKGNMDAGKALTVYNSWYGLGYSDTEPNQDSCMKQVDFCADLGLDAYVLDAGWQKHFGDWEPAPLKFPNGLKPISDYCHEKGLKFGLWIDGRAACKCSGLLKMVRWK